MHYFGGKARIRKPLSEYLESVRRPKQYFVEPFCGGLWVTSAMSGTRIASDANPALITLYQAAQAGWVPPTDVTPEMYAKYKSTQDPHDPVTAFVGIGCSFAGKWFGGFANGAATGRNYAANASNSLLEKIAACKDVIFFSGDYKQALSRFVVRSLVYLDPPYKGTTGYSATGSFDSGMFWHVVRTVSWSHDVYVSEYTAPPDFECVAEFSTRTDIRGKEGRIKRVEKLFKYAP